MKNLKTLWLAMALVFGASAAHAQMGRHDRKFQTPVGVNGIPAQNLDFVGVAVDTANAAGTVTGNQQSAKTNARLYFSGEGVFYGIAISSGAVGDWAACFDAAAVAETLTPFTLGDTTLVGAVQAITTEWRYFGASGKGGPPPVRIRKGLVCDSTLGTIVGNYIPYFEKK